MDNEPDKEHEGRRNSNTEYVPTKCRITKPPPPKPATNPLQFIKVAPCPLFQKAQEQIKKVEEIKKERKEIREEAEDWQANLDNWKSSRRKRQEHIIERVVEVKKLAAEEENERLRRKSKTFSEMIEDRGKGRHKFTIPVYDDDSNDLSDYGIGSSSSKTNSVKDVDTDDSCSILDEKEYSNNRDSSSQVPRLNQDEYQSEAEVKFSSEKTSSCIDTVIKDENNVTKSLHMDTLNDNKVTVPKSVVNPETHDPPLQNLNNVRTEKDKINVSNTYPQVTSVREKPKPPAKPEFTSKLKFEKMETSKENETEQYTYEGAIQDYRSRIRLKINMDESFFAKAQDSSRKRESPENNGIVPKGDIVKRKEVFESEKTIEVKNYESAMSKRLSEDFANSKSIKQRLKNLEKCTDNSTKGNVKSDFQTVSVKERLQNFNKANNNYISNNGTNNINKTYSNKMSIQKSHSSSSFPTNTKPQYNNWQSKEEISDRSSSPETETYINNLNMFNRDLLIYGKSSSSLDDKSDNFYLNSNYAPSSSSTEFLGLSSDREDSGIHTADVSCSVSQADESNDIAEVASKNTILSDSDNFGEKKNHLENIELLETRSEEFSEGSVDAEFIMPKSSTPTEKIDMNKEQHTSRVIRLTKDELVKATEDLLISLQQDACQNLPPKLPPPPPPPTRQSIPTVKELQPKVLPEIETRTVHIKEEPDSNQNISSNNVSYTKQPTKPVIYENVEIIPEIKSKPYENIEIKPSVKTYENIQLLKMPSEPLDVNLLTNDILADSNFSLAPPKLEPPKVKPPPPPPPDFEPNTAELNPTQRLKKEINVKRSSFLGLYDTLEDNLESQMPLEKPPDINYFLQRESKLEKSLYKKIQEENRMGMLSKVASQDSGLDIDRGRLSSDTWCSSTADSTTPSHDRQDSDHTNSITSEEDEIMKKEREIIEMVEKEEKSRDNDFGSYKIKSDIVTNSYRPYEKCDKFSNPYNVHPANYLDDQDSEVLKVEQELRQLEHEELERQKENMLFKESRAKAYIHNRHSLENLCDDVHTGYKNNMEYRRTMAELKCAPQEYRKSMPDVLSAYNMAPEMELHYRKSLPDIQHIYKSNVEYRKPVLESPVKVLVDHRKLLPDLQRDVHQSAFIAPINQQPIVQSPLHSHLKESRCISVNPMSPSVPADMDRHPCYPGKTRQLSRHTLHTLSAAPRPKHTDSWIRPEPKSYNQHWVYQEAELRRLSDQHKNLSNQNQQQPPKKHLPDSIIETLTRRVQNRANTAEWNTNPHLRRQGDSLNKDYAHHHLQYMCHSKNTGCVLPMSYNNIPSVPIVDPQDRMLSVSGKKKCSYCGNELGRGAAMIIESLCLFYHMECFKCCVCHLQLGDGLMGTDVRVRNQKLHCHNCYSSDDGVKFSCV